MLALCAFLGFFGCGDGASKGTPPPAPPIESIWQNPEAVLAQAQFQGGFKGEPDSLRCGKTVWAENRQRIFFSTKSGSLRIVAVSATDVEDDAFAMWVFVFHGAKFVHSFRASDDRTRCHQPEDVAVRSKWPRGVSALPFRLRSLTQCGDGESSKCCCAEE